ncbi:MAG: RlmF-related methyltransferase, partial [Vibrio sp.]
DITLCNPPFHESLEKAAEGSLRKVKNLNKGKDSKHDLVLNFAGVEQELSVEGGEIAFLRTMAQESKDFAHQVGWFTSLISKKENVQLMHQSLQKIGANQVRVVEMAQGQKISRFIAWSFFSKAKLDVFLGGESDGDVEANEV